MKFEISCHSRERGNPMKYFLPLCLLFALPCITRAADVSEILKARSRAAKLPITDTAILFHETLITLCQDGCMDRQEHIFRYLRKDNSWDDYGDPHLAFDSDRQELEVQVSRTHTADGRQVDTTPNGFNPMVPFGLDATPDFAHYRQMVVTHLGIEYDAVTELQYVIRDKEPLYPWAWGEFLFGGNEPILQRRIEVRVPAGMKLHTQEERGAPKAVTHLLMNGEKQNVYVWEMKDLPAMNLSEAGAKPHRSLPRVVFSTCPDWPTLCAEINRRFLAGLSETGTLAADLADLKQLSNQGQRLDSVIVFMKDRLVPKNYDDQSFLLNFRTAEKTYNTGYGSPADLAVIYAAALKATDLNPQVFLLVPDMPSATCLNGSEEYVICCKASGMDSWIYPKSGEVKYQPPEGDLLGLSPLAAAGNPPQSGGALARRRGDFKLDLGITFKEDKTAGGWIVIHQSGALARYDKARSKSAEELVKEWISGIFSVPEIQDARIIAMNPDAVEVKANLNFAVPEKMLDGILRVDVPWKAGGMEGLAPQGLALNYPSRDLPLFLDNTGTFEVNLQIAYPAEWSCNSGWATLSQSAEGISLQRSVRQAKGLLALSEKVDFTTSPIPIQNWDAWRKVLLAADQVSARTILLGIEKEESKQAKK